MRKAHRPWPGECWRGIRAKTANPCCLMITTRSIQVLHETYTRSMLMEMERSRCDPYGFHQPIARPFCPPYENMRPDIPSESVARISRTISSGFSISGSNPGSRGQTVRGSLSWCPGCAGSFSEEAESVDILVHS